METPTLILILKIMGLIIFDMAALLALLYFFVIDVKQEGTWYPES